MVINTGEYNIERVCLQYPDFFEHVSRYCDIIDIVNIYKTNKLIHNKLLTKKNKLWWDKACYDKKEIKYSLCYNIRSNYYDLCKLSFHDSLFTESAILLYSNDPDYKKNTYDTIKKIRDIVTENKRNGNKNHVEKSIKLIIESKLFLKNVFDVSKNTNDENVLDECLWVYSNILASDNKDNIRWLYEQGVVSSIQNILSKDYKNEHILEACIWPICNLIGDNPIYFRNECVVNCVKSILKQSSNSNNYKLFKTIIWLLANLAQTKKKYVYHLILSFLIKKQDVLGINIETEETILNDYCNLILRLLLNGDKHIYQRIEYSGLLNNIVVSCLDITVCTICLKILVTFTSKYKPENNTAIYILSLLNILVSGHTIRFLTIEQVNYIGVITSNIISNNIKKVSNFMMKRTDILSYLKKKKRLQCQAEYIMVLYSIFCTNRIEHINYIIDKYKCLKYFKKILHDSYDMKNISKRRNELVCNCIKTVRVLINRDFIPDETDEFFSLLEQYRNHRVESIRNIFKV